MHQQVPKAALAQLVSAGHSAVFRLLAQVTHIGCGADLRIGFLDTGSIVLIK